MGRNTWYLIKSSKNFNVRVYRWGLVMLGLALVSCATLGILIFYEYLRMPKRDYYATSGVAPPIQLTDLNTPNMSSTPLLPPDPSTDEVVRQMPQ
jgi:intracellular multiplication protein IcmM